MIVKYRFHFVTETFADDFCFLVICRLFNHAIELFGRPFNASLAEFCVFDELFFRHVLTIPHAQRDATDIFDLFHFSLDAMV